LYYIIGSGINLFFQEELEGITPTRKNILCGVITGGIYKSTLGFGGAASGMLMGGLFIGTLSMAVNTMYENNLVSFEMKF
jgi:hypothetical protein